VASANILSSPWKVPRPWTPALVFGLGVLLLLPSIWSETSVTGQDEYWLSFRTPMEMDARGQWLTPWVNGEPRLQKPPLLYWAILMNYKLFGVNLVSARSWGVLSGAGLALCACLFSRELFQRDGLLAGLLALATFGVAVEGRRAMLDLPCALFSTLAVLCFVKWVRGTAFLSSGGGSNESSAGFRREPWWITLSALFLGFSFLIKGPVGFLFFGAGVISCLLFTRRSRQDTPLPHKCRVSDASATPHLHGRTAALEEALPAPLVSPRRFSVRSWWQLMLGLGVLAAVCLPWPLVMRHLWAERLGKILGEELAARQFGHWTPGSPLSAWSGALGLVLPWTPLLLGAVWFQFFGQKPDNLQQKRFLLGWFLLAAVPFFFMRSFERYMLALLPAQIVLCADWLHEEGTRGREVLLRLCVLLLAFVALAICLFAWWFKVAGWQVFVLTLFTIVALVLVFRRAHPHWVALASALLFTFALGAVYPRFGINALPQNLSTELADYPVRLFASAQPSLISIRLGRSIQEFKPLSEGTNASSLLAPEMMLVEGSRSEQFLDDMGKRQVHAEKRGSFLTFYSRRAWIRFARPDATWEDWRIAIRNRSLEGLKSEFHYYLVSASGKQSSK